MAYVDADKLNGIVIIDGKKRKYAIIQDEVQFENLLEKLTNGDIRVNIFYILFFFYIHLILYCFVDERVLIIFIFLK